MTPNILAIVMLCASMALTTGSEACVKLLAIDLPAGQILALRGTMICLVLAPLAAISGCLRSIPRGLRPMVFWRGGAEVLASYVYFLALRHMPLPPATAIILTAPLMMTIAAAVLFGERIGWRQWANLAFGFCGVLVILRPSAGAFNPYALLVLLAGAGTVARDLLTTRISRSIPSLLILLVSVSGMTAFGYALSVEGNWRWPSADNWLLLVIAAVTASLASFAAIRAFRLGEIAIIAPFRYTVIIWSGCLGFLIWGYVFDGPAVVGVATIVGSGLYTLHRERVKMQQAAALVAVHG